MVTFGEPWPIRLGLENRTLHMCPHLDRVVARLGSTKKFLVSDGPKNHGSVLGRCRSKIFKVPSIRLTWSRTSRVTFPRDRGLLLRKSDLGPDCTWLHEPSTGERGSAPEVSCYTFSQERAKCQVPGSEAFFRGKVTRPWIAPREHANVKSRSWGKEGRNPVGRSWAWVSTMKKVTFGEPRRIRLGLGIPTVQVCPHLVQVVARLGSRMKFSGCLTVRASGVKHDFWSNLSDRAQT